MRRALFAFALTLFSASAALAQGSYPLASPVATNRFGQPIKATVAICSTYPGITTTGCAGNLVTTYTDITDTVACSGAAGTQFLNNQNNASDGTACSNPGFTDSSGNVLAFAAPGLYWCQYYGSNIVTYVMPCQFGSSGGGGGSIGPITQGYVPVAGPGLNPTLLNSSIIENGQLLRTPEPWQAYSYTATCVNCGLDETGGDGSNLGQQPGHSYLWSESAANYAFRYQPNGADPVVSGNAIPTYVMPNPAGSVVHIDGIRFTSACDYVQNRMPANSYAVIFDDIPDHFTCNPFAQGNGKVVKIILGAYTSGYVSDVPLTLGTDEQLVGAGRAHASATSILGSQIQPSTSYANPYISAAPSGFTFSATSTGCTSPPAAGNYYIGVTWGPDTIRESALAQETQVALSGSNCLKVTPPGSPAAGVTTYTIYACAVAGCGTGNEKYQGTSAIGNAFTIANGISGTTGYPPTYNTTGAFIALGSAGSAADGSANFGVKLMDLSVDCNASDGSTVTGCIGAYMSTAEEGSGIFRVDFTNCGGTSCIYWTGAGGIGTAASNSRIQTVTVNQGLVNNPSVSAIILDNVSSFRGLDDFTVTPLSGAFGASEPCVLAIGATLPPNAGTTISNGHMEKCGNGTAGGLFLKNFFGTVMNMTCSPTNVNPCVHNDNQSFQVTYIGIRGGSSDSPIWDDVTGFKSAKSFESFYSSQMNIGMISLTAGPAPSCTATGIGATGTCTMKTGSNNMVGVMNLNTSGGGETGTGTFSLSFNGSYGVNGSTCQWTPLSGPSAWANNTSIRSTAIGIGHDDAFWVNGGSTGTALTDASGYSVAYICLPF